MSLGPSRTPSGVCIRFFFSDSESGIGGVLEVSASMPSICYSTQTLPSRPIEIVAVFLGLSAVVASYATPEPGEPYCDRSVSKAIAGDIINNPSRYFIRWQPILTGEIATTPLSHRLGGPPISD